MKRLFNMAIFSIILFLFVIVITMYIHSQYAQSKYQKAIYSQTQKIKSISKNNEELEKSNYVRIKMVEDAMIKLADSYGGGGQEMFEIIEKIKKNDTKNIDELINTIPDTMEEYKREMKIKFHGLQNYTMRIDGMIFPFSVDESWVTCEDGEFGYRYWKGNKELHPGTDFKSKGDKIMAMGDGIVLDVGEAKKGGNYILSEHYIDGETYRLYMAHLFSYNVKKDDLIKKSDIIATMGNTGKKTSGKHLHVTLMKYDKKLKRWIYINLVRESTYNKSVMTGYYYIKQYYNVKKVDSEGNKYYEKKFRYIPKFI